ncbi:uncharacterized protein LOC107884458 [Acyrthosiphon pisum]|uniref:Uncharacterized protein n=1 Tax=Acyrthosiphon pisum TaxID=7029 RepID=A0A8R2HAQ0_ACYPI|nr:uncharacterized protein LOC107884458 [Acyrthosiphon pisum]|eukprot:XP_016662066.1 PREDICTED: uncharacterized protein LOC107884458 [Acyrthosiphon pisum]
MASSSVARGADVRKDPVDGVAQRRRRELQVVRAELQACRRTTETLCRQIADDRVKLDTAVTEYGRRSADLAKRQSEAHGRLVAVLYGRSAAECRREMVHDRAENELRARRTASTVRAYRLDARWQQLHGRYRGFAMEVLDTGRRSSSSSPPLPPPTPPTPPVGMARRRLGPAKQGRRFFALADHVGTQYRRESLRTSRSLHRLMSGYLKETSSGSPSPSRDGRTSLNVLDDAEPVQVLDKLRVMQEQCARIAERVRRRTTTGRTEQHPPETSGGKRPQTDVLLEAQRTLMAGQQYLSRIRRLMELAIGEVEREQIALRRLLCATCATCVGKRAPLRYGSSAVTEIAGRLERACFALFARLDKAGAPGPRSTPDRTDQAHANSQGTATHDVVTLCLRAVREHRVNAVRSIQDTERRVGDFRKAVARLLLAATPRSDLAGAAADTYRRHSGRASARSTHGKRKTSTPPNQMTEAGGRRWPPTTRTLSNKTTVMSPKSSLRTKYYNYGDGGTTEFTVAVPTTVTMLCPPSIGTIQYE